MYIKRSNSDRKAGCLYEERIRRETRKEMCKMSLQENIFVGPVRSKYVTYLIHVVHSGWFHETLYEGGDVYIS